LSFHFLLPASSSFTFFLLASSPYFFECSLQLKVSIRKVKLSSSIPVVPQASQTAVVFYQFFKFNCLMYFRTSQTSIVFFQFPSSIVRCTFGLLRLHFFLRFLSSSTILFRSFICLSTSKVLSQSISLSTKYLVIFDFKLLIKR
jgi:hypothetical protein